MKDNILQTIAERKRLEVSALKALMPLHTLQRLAEDTPCRPRSMSRSLLETPGGIIAEFKRRSPSKGEMSAMANPAVVVDTYTRVGAAACSVLTDTAFFGGSLTDLAVARRATALPLLRKDFTIDEYQIYQARVFGADAILLIASLLSPEQVEDLAEVAHTLGLEVLLEIHNADEVRAYSPVIDMIGVNSRDLRSFSTDLQISLDMASLLPPKAVKVAESGIHSPQDLHMLRQAGYNAFLIGGSLMSAPDPEKLLKSMISNE